MGSLVKCSGCGERCGSKPISVYWRWQRADQQWKSYSGRYCAGCYAAKCLALDAERPAGARLACPGCGVDTEDDYDAVYTTSYPNPKEATSIDAPFCAACAAMFRIWVQEHARDTDDGGRALERPSTAAPAQATPAQTIAALGRLGGVR